MAHKWIRKVKETKRLLVYVDPTVQTGMWGSLIDASIGEFNQLSKQHRLGVTLQKSGDPPIPGRGGADVLVASANGQIDFRYDGIEQTLPFDGTRLHGKTRQIRTDQGMEKAYMYLPAQPMINTPNGRRAVGPAIMKLIAVHELVHACGLVDAEHSTRDLFQGNPNVDYGQSAARDRAMGKRGNLTVWMPPLFLSAETARRIKDNWA
jgi:hypothetical protein